MLAGRTPYVAASSTELLIMHLTETPRPLREFVPDVPMHAAAAIARGLSRARNDRFDSIAAFVGALGAGGNTAVLKSASPSPSRRSPVSRVERTVALPASTTFSRTAGEIQSDKNATIASRPRRWPFVLGGVAVAGLALLLARPSGKTASDATTGIAASAASAVAPIRQEPPPSPAEETPAPVALPSKPDAGVVSPAVTKPPATTKRQRSTAKKQAEGSQDEIWVAH